MGHDYEPDALTTGLRSTQNLSLFLSELAEISLVGYKKSKKYEADSIIAYEASRNGDMSTRQP